MKQTLTPLQLQIISFEEECSVMHKGREGRFIFPSLNEKVVALSLCDSGGSKTVYKIPIEEISLRIDGQ